MFDYLDYSEEARSEEEFYERPSVNEKVALELAQRPAKVISLCPKQEIVKEVPKEKKDPVKYTLIIRNESEIVFKAPVTDEVLGVLEHFRALMMCENSREHQEKTIRLTLPGVTKEACIQYVKWLQWRKNGCVDAIPSAFDPSAIILAHYLQDSMFLNGWATMTSSNNEIRWVEEKTGETEDPICLSIMIPVGIYSMEQLATVIANLMTKQSLHNGRYLVTAGSCGKPDNQVNIKIEGVNLHYYIFHTSTFPVYGSLTLTRPKSVFSVRGDFPSGYPEGWAERLCEMYIESILLRRVPWYVRLEIFVQESEALATIILANQSLDLVTWLGVPSHSRHKVSSLKKIPDLLEYTTGMKKRYGWVDCLPGNSPFENDVEINKIYETIERFSREVGTSLMFNNNTRTDILGRIDQEYAKLYARMEKLSKNKKPLERREPFNYKFYM